MSASTTDFFQLATVNTAAGVAWGDVTIVHVALGLAERKLPGCGIQLYNKDGAHVVEYSFDNVNTAGELDPADGTRGKSFDGRLRSDIYLRIKAASAGPVIVSVEAWVP